MDFGAAFQHVDVLFAGMVDEFAELLDRFHAYARQHGNHAFAPKFRAQIVVIIVGRVDAHGVFDAADAATRGYRRFGDCVLLGEQFRHAQFEPLAELQEFVVGQGQPIVFHLRQGRQRNAGVLAHLFQGPALACAQGAQQATDGGVMRRHGYRHSLGNQQRSQSFGCGTIIACVGVKQKNFVSRPRRRRPRAQNQPPVDNSPIGIIMAESG